MNGLLIEQYRARVNAGALQFDAAQETTLAVLDRLYAQIANSQAGNAGWLDRFFTRSKPAPRGLYLYGAVGRGKSFLMDMFFVSAAVKAKRRVHFHQFMLEVHDRLHRYQTDGVATDGVLPQLARDLAAEASLLCFDEFHVSNIADAMILGRLFEGLLAAGVLIVATSNSSPDELYKGGLQRERFLPFIALIKQRMDVHCLDGPVDHRYEHLRGMNNYFTPLGGVATVAMQAVFDRLTRGAIVSEVILPVLGRSVTVRRAAQGVAWFEFDELCTQPLAAADYLAIAMCFHTIMLNGLPLLTAGRRDETLRFVTLVDTFYEAKVQLFLTAAVAPDALCPEGEVAFAFQRTVSRLIEMQTEEYRQSGHLNSNKRS